MSKFLESGQTKCTRGGSTLGRLCKTSRNVLRKRNLPCQLQGSKKTLCLPGATSCLQGSYPFLNKKFKDFSRTFKDTFRIFNGLHSVQKRAWSLCLFSFFHTMRNFIPKVCPCLLLFLCSSP